MKEEMLDDIKQFIKNPKGYELLYSKNDDIHNEYALSVTEAQRLINYISQLESNWKKLKKWLEEKIYNIEPKGTGINFNCEYDSEEDYIRAMKIQSKLLTLKGIKNKMQELESGNNECN